MSKRQNAKHKAKVRAMNKMTMAIKDAIRKAELAEALRLQEIRIHKAAVQIRWDERRERNRLKAINTPKGIDDAW